MRKLIKKEWEYNKIIQLKDNNEYNHNTHNILFVSICSLSLSLSLSLSIKS